MERNLLLGCILLIFVACTSKNSDVVKRIPISFHRVCEEDFLMAAPVKMALCDTMMALVDVRMDTLIHIVDVKNGEYKGKTGALGQGPNEFSYISSIASCKDGWLLVDSNVGALYKLHFNGKPCLNRIFRYTNSAGYFHNQIIPVTDSLFITTGIYFEGRFCILNGKGDIIHNKLEEYPWHNKEEQRIPGIVKSQLYAGGILLSPDKTKMLAYTNVGDLLSFYHINGDSLCSVEKRYISFPQKYRYQGDHYMGISKEEQYSYINGVATDSYVFLIYSGRSVQEYGLRAFYGTSVFVFNWDGKKVAELTTDVDLVAIEISPTGDALYAIAYAPEPTLMYSVLPDLE